TSNVINLTNAVYSLTNDAPGDLNLSRNTIINGQNLPILGYTIVRGGEGWTHRIFSVQAGANVQMNNLSIQHGDVPALEGGGIDVVSGTLALDNVVILFNDAGRGGGIANHGSLSLSNTNIAFNTAFTRGAGIYNAAPISFNAGLTATL